MYDALGGDAAILDLATAHHERCLADPVLNHPFSHGGHPDHIQRLAWYWAEVFGGPARFTEECGGQSAMLFLHSATGADADFPDRFLACFLGAIDDVGVPDDAELRGALRAYMEWAAHDVHGYSPQDAVVPPGLAVPHWSWDGLQAG